MTTLKVVKGTASKLGPIPFVLERETKGALRYQEVAMTKANPSKWFGPGSEHSTYAKLPSSTARPLPNALPSPWKRCHESQNFALV